MDSYVGRKEEPHTLHKYLYCHTDPINGIDPSGYLGLFRYTRDFGNEAHRVIQNEYQAMHFGAIVGSTTGILGTGLKPDIFDGIDHVYMEIKPLSLSGVAAGVAQIAAYDAAFTFLGVGYSRGTWPDGVRPAWVGQVPIAYFNVAGIIFYTDMVDNLDDLATISSYALAREFIRKYSWRLARTFSGSLIRIPGLVGGATASAGAGAQAMTGIAATNSMIGNTP